MQIQEIIDAFGGLSATSRAIHAATGASVPVTTIKYWVDNPSSLSLFRAKQLLAAAKLCRVPIKERDFFDDPIPTKGA